MSAPFTPATGLHLNLSQVQKEFGSPNFILSESRLQSNLNEFVRFTESPARIFFPVKANPSLSVLTLLADQGCGADCSSPHEVNLALLAGIPYARILYTTPATDVDYGMRLLSAGASVIVDNELDLHEIDARVSLLNSTPSGKILVRVNPDFPIRYGKKADYQDLTAHAADSSKFGISAESLLEVTGKIKLRISGLHLHVGTQMDRLEPFSDALSHLHQWADSLREQGHPIELLDLGGGLGIPFGPEDRFPSVSEFSNHLAPLCRRDLYSYAVEPGHALIGDAVSLLTEVIKIKPSRGKRWGVVNVGTETLAKVTLLKWQHRVFTQECELPWEGPDVLAGPLCFAGDTLLHETDIGPLRLGAPLLIASTGAYCASLSNRFNGRLSPGFLIQTLDGSVVRTQSSENGLLDPTIQSYQWSSLKKPLSSERPSPDELAREFYRLGSPYLWHLAAADQYKITEVNLIQKGQYELKILTRSAVNFVSAPFALRLVGDAAIMSTLHDAGFSQKTQPVWGRTIILECQQQIQSGGSLDCRLELSPVHQSPGSASRKVWIRFDLDHGKFTGHLEMIY